MFSVAHKLWSLSASRKVQRSWKRTSVYLDRLWRACCTDTERLAFDFTFWRRTLSGLLLPEDFLFLWPEPQVSKLLPWWWRSHIFQSRFPRRSSFPLCLCNLNFPKKPKVPPWRAFQIRLSCILRTVALELTPQFFCRRVRVSLPAEAAPLWVNNQEVHLHPLGRVLDVPDAESVCVFTVH